MRKVSKSLVRILSCVISLVLLVSTVAAAGAADVYSSGYGSKNILNVDPEILAKADDQIYPTIMVPGIGQSYSFLANENGEPVKNSKGSVLGGKMFILDNTKTSNIALKGLLFPLLSSFFGQKTSENLKKALPETIAKMFEIQSTNLRGEPVNNLVVETYNYPLAGMTADRKAQFYSEAPMQSFIDIVGEENIYFFAYPIIGNPIESGKQLHEYIQMVKAQRGVDKVNLLTLSLGGTVLTSYLDLNLEQDGVACNPNDINKIVNGVSLLNGTEVMTDLMSYNFNKDDAFLYRDFLPMIMSEGSDNPAMGYLANILIRLLPRQTYEDIIQLALEGIMDGMIRCNPQFWAMVKPDKYEEIAEMQLSGAEYDTVRAKTDRFNQARANLPVNLLRLRDEYGVSTCSFCGYNLPYTTGAYNFFGIMQSSVNTNSDAVIHLASTSMGATYLPVGQVFDDDYLATHDPKYISPSGGVDASTCLFPDTTWFCESQHHEASGNDTGLELMLYVTLGAIDDINSEPEKYPQFNLGRDIKSLGRNYISAAEKILNENAGSTDAKFVELEAAYNAALELLAATNVFTAPDAQTVTDRLLSAMTPYNGMAPKAPHVPDLFEKMLKGMSDNLFDKIGGVGFTDKWNSRR